MKGKIEQPKQLSFSGKSLDSVNKGTEKFKDDSEEYVFMADLSMYYNIRLSQKRPTDIGRTANEIKTEIWLNVWDCWKMKNRFGYNVAVNIEDLI
jgi:hypothetical protein